MNKTFFHKLFILFIILLLPLFLIKEYRIIKAKKDTQVFETQDFFQSQLEENNNKVFTFILLTHNHLELIDENFESLINQDYSQFQVIYIDQGSTDGTVHRLRELTQAHHVEKRVHVIEAKRDHEAFQAYFDLIDQLDPGEIVVHLSPYDVLAHTEVLCTIDQAYTNPDVWMTYGQYFDYYSFKKGIYKAKPQKILCRKRVQRAPWLSASLKTFYAEHFKKVKHGEGFERYFLSIESEADLLKPLAELGKAHVQFIPDVLYLHQSESIMQKKKMQISSFAKTHSNVLSEALPNDFGSVDLILFSQNDTEKLKKCLSSVQQHLQGVGHVSVLYECFADTVGIYLALQKKYPNFSFVRLGENEEFKTVFLQSLSASQAKSPYVILSSDHVVVKEDILLSSCIEAMRKSCAYGFYFHLGPSSKKQTQDEIFSWTIEKGKKAWREPNVLKMALYRKVDLERDFKNAHFQNCQELIDLWAKREGRYFGLSFDRPKIQ